MAAQTLFQQEKFAQCLEQCEQDVKYMTSAEKKFPLHVLAAQAAIQCENIEKAKYHAELCVKLEPGKMVAWQTLYDALSSQKQVANNSRDATRLAQVLSTQARIAKKNGNVERAVGFNKLAAEQYERCGDLVLASEHWEEAYDMNPTAYNDVVYGMAQCYEQMNDTLRADKCWWLLCEQTHSLEAALRLLSRPCHVILEARRNGQISEHIKSQESGAWQEFERRLGVMLHMEIPVFRRLLFACQQRLETNLQQCDFAIEVINSAAVDGEEEEKDLAVQARAWFLVAKLAFSKGDPVAAQKAIDRAEDLEQRVYAKFSSSSSGANRVIGSEFIVRPFTGREVLSLVCARTEETLLIKAKCLVSYFPTNVTIREGLRSAERALAQIPSGREKQEVQELCQLLSILCKSSYPFSIPAGAEFAASKQSKLVKAFYLLQADDLLSSSSGGGDWFQRRMFYFLYSACRTLRHELLNEQALEDTVHCCPVERCDEVRSLLALQDDRDDDAMGRIFADLWAARMAFSRSGGGFAPEQVTQLLNLDSTLALACELLGKYYMGMDSTSRWFHEVPEVQTDRKRVRDPAKAVKYLALGVQHDAFGLGCIAPLANAYHAAAQEEKAKQLYESVVSLQQRNAGGGDLLLEFCFVRLGQQQLHFNQPVLAANSFQRALAIRGNDNLAALCGLGEADARMGRLGAATQNLQRALELAPGGNPAVEFKLAQLLAATGSTEEAISAFRKLAEDPTAALLPVRVELAECLLEQARYLMVRGSMTESKFLLQESLANFSVVQNYKGMGDVYGELQEWEQAEQWYLKACQKEPWDALLRYDLARVLLHRKSNASVPCSESCVLLNPSDAQSWNLLGMARVTDDVYVAQHCFVRSLQLAPNSFASPWLNLGWALLENNKPALAKRAFSQAQTIEPDSTQAWLGHFKCSKDPAALECAAEAVKYNASEDAAATALLLLGDVLLAQAREDNNNELLDVSSRAIQFARTNDERARALALAGQVLESPTYFAKAIDAGFDDERNIARAQLNMEILTKQQGGVMPLFDTSLQDDDFDYLHALGRLEFNLGMYEKASQAFERAMNFGIKSLEIKLDWLEAIVNCKDHDADFAMQSAIAWAERVALEEEGDNTASLLQRFAVLQDGAYVSLLNDKQRLELNPLMGVYREPWNLQMWSRLAESPTHAIFASRSLLALSQEENCRSFPLLFKAGTCLLKQENEAMVVAAREGYWTRNDASTLQLKLKHLCPWEETYATIEGI